MKRKRHEKRKFNIVFGPLQREVLGLLLVTSGILTLLSLLGATSGVLSDWWGLILRRIFGWGAYSIAFALGASGVSILAINLGWRPKMKWKRLVGSEVVLLAALALLHLLAAKEDAFLLAKEGRGGGYLGWAISSVLVEKLGAFLSTLLLLFAVGFGSALALDLSLDQLLALTAKAISLPRPHQPVPKRRRSPPKKVAKVQRTSQKVKKGKKPKEARRPPSLDLLEKATSISFADTEVRRKARIIEETLSSFGVPAKVVEINRGPVVTQFGVEPGYIERKSADGRIRRRKVRVSRISALADDLALALAQAPIRIEAPVPGRPFVGIEVPNEKISLVPLRGVMESEAFKALNSKLAIALGRGVSGEPVVADLATMPHLLIGGATGSGKSVCISSIATCLALNNMPHDLRLVMIDPKMVELVHFNGLPHLLGKVESDLKRVLCVLRWVIREMERRFDKFALLRVRNIEEANRKLKEERLPYIVVIIDELADLMFASPEEVERTVCRIAQMARATGIHLVVATQRPSVDVVTGLIKANFPARISFATSSQVDSRVILDSGGAEKLLGGGDMLYLASDSSSLVRVQGCFVSERDIRRVVRFWRERVPKHLLKEAAPWEGMIAEAEADELLEEAIKLTERYHRISASFLQRKLRIGYPRAVRILEQLEEKGILPQKR
jgi:S-DNA-T family DNA segregation ATPase FtsK/SpoIIIE